MKEINLVRLVRSRYKSLIKLIFWIQLFILIVLSLISSSTRTFNFANIHESDTDINNLEYSHKFINFIPDNWNNTQQVVLKDKNGIYFRKVGESDCYIQGTDFTHSLSKCECLPEYFGPHCGIPISAWASHYKHHKKDVSKLKPRKTPRRIIHGLQVNHEFDLFEARLNILKDVVDVYIVLESNYSTYGAAKPLHFLNKFKSGWLAEHQDQLLYIFQSFFPKAGETNGWFADSYLRLFMAKNGMRLIDGLREDDVFLLLDADEIPNVESLMFLKLFDGWSEPVKFGFRWTVFGFFWLKSEDPGLMESVPLIGRLLNQGNKKEKLLTLYVACTVGMLQAVYGNNGMLLRRNVWSHSLLKDKLDNYTSNHAKPSEWTLGNSPNYAGHHCSWCYSPEGIRTKMSSAQRDDKPRWGDYPDKMELEYIRSRIESGKWFDGKQPFIKVNRRKIEDKMYAPRYFLDNEDKFEYLLVPPDERI